ncbi:hypothetical protein W97_02740 [Coniosporium apollinis CBS 100218]|uniref:Protein EFR3 n=1 Tax=Coniosporium apollinis (strain CBS 100218) TaxID=1168221 RepID=R7YNP4_CONA1|nr:uncharacterized protein W97_02740 [Coniosporium apollinis CBS 100218]EON63512.1 hypothetical protein W97_02740 [Coniosporium apollinis CBS 100218]
MNAIRQSLRPKHQVLVLKCYPQFRKNNNVEVKPNSSELSYLLYYASTRRSKLQKVGDFLDMKNARDVSKARISNVQVTLQILRALIEKCPRDLPLFSGALLRIFRTILKSNDLTLLEESVPTFDTFCAHQDPATLAADQDYIKQYEEVVQLYAAFASKEPQLQTRAPISWPVATRFRKAGLEAIKSVASSASLSSETGRQLSVIIPVILLNIYSKSGSYLSTLEHREREKESTEKAQEFRRRQSMATVRTFEDNEADPLAASGTTEDADKLAEEEVGIVALQALRHVFVGVNRGQLRLATSTVISFVGNRVKPHEHFSFEKPTAHTGSWPTTLFGMICGWAPVQDRYIILVTAMETLIRSPIVEEDLNRQLVLATIIGWLLRSKINFIGLSVMDVLIGLIQHILLLLQLGGKGSGLYPHHQQADVISPTSPRVDAFSQGAPRNSSSTVLVEVTQTPSPSRIRLLEQLQKAIGSLATHIYYTDQVSDMVSTIFMRLKPSLQSDITSTVAAIEDPVGAADAVAGSINMKQPPGTDNFFSFDTAKITALTSIKDILIVANSKIPEKRSSAVGRSQVGIPVWEGTQWLLRDPNGEVRKAYADTLLTWLDLEMRKDDLRVDKDRSRAKKPERKPLGLSRSDDLARRAISNASQRDRSPKHARSTFLQLLHLAIYDNAHQYAESEPDILLAHLLLSRLVHKLGVNAACFGLPMILRLQEDIQLITSPTAKVHIGSLVHGYLWALSIVFDFEVSSIGREIHSEISRRSSLGMWVSAVRYPPLPLDRIGTPSSISRCAIPTEIVQTGVLKPFDDRRGLVDRIATGYTEALITPPSSPQSSPGRRFSVAAVAQPVRDPSSNELPQKIQEELLFDWSKDAVIAATTKKENSSSGSFTGSGPRTHRSAKNNLLTVSGGGAANDDAANSGAASPLRTHHSRRSKRNLPAEGFGLPPPGRRGTSASNSSRPSSSSVRSTVHVQDLKKVLNGEEPVRLNTSYSRKSRHSRLNEDSDSSSLVSADGFSFSDASFVHQPPVGDTFDHAERRRSDTQGSALPRPGNIAPGSTATGEQYSSERERRAEDIPPVPPLPASLQSSAPHAQFAPKIPARKSAGRASVEFEGAEPGHERPKTSPAPATTNGAVYRGTEDGVAGRGSVSVKGSVRTAGSRYDGRKGAGGAKDLLGLLDAIDTGSMESGGTIGKAPY